MQPNQLDVKVLARRPPLALPLCLSRNYLAAPAGEAHITAARPVHLVNHSSFRNTHATPQKRNNERLLHRRYIRTQVRTNPRVLWFSLRKQSRIVSPAILDPTLHRSRPNEIPVGAFRADSLSE